MPVSPTVLSSPESVPSICPHSSWAHTQPCPPFSPSIQQHFWCLSCLAAEARCHRPGLKQPTFVSRCRSGSWDPRARCQPASPLVSAFSYEALVPPGAAFLAAGNRMLTPRTGEGFGLCIGGPCSAPSSSHLLPSLYLCRPLELTVTEQGRWWSGARSLESVTPEPKSPYPGVISEHQFPQQKS